MDPIAFDLEACESFETPIYLQSFDVDEGVRLRLTRRFEDPVGTNSDTSKEGFDLWEAIVKREVDDVHRRQVERRILPSGGGGSTSLFPIPGSRRLLLLLIISSFAVRAP